MLRDVDRITFYAESLMALQTNPLTERYLTIVRIFGITPEGTKSLFKKKNFDFNLRNNEHNYNSLTHIFLKLIGSLLSPCACNFIGQAP